MKKQEYEKEIEAFLKDITCPRCESGSIDRKLSSGGPCLYASLQCKDCNFEGGTSRVYWGERERVNKEILERFTNGPRVDAVRETLASMGL